MPQDVYAGAVRRAARAVAVGLGASMIAAACGAPSSAGPLENGKPTEALTWASTAVAGAITAGDKPKLFGLQVDGTDQRWIDRVAATYKGLPITAVGFDADDGGEGGVVTYRVECGHGRLLSFIIVFLNRGGVWKPSLGMATTPASPPSGDAPPAMSVSVHAGASVETSMPGSMSDTDQRFPRCAS